MAISIVLSAVAAIVLYHLFGIYRSLSRNLNEAKASGLPVVVTPLMVYQPFWLATYYIWLPFLRRLPAFLQGIWIE
jgi:hypothetical protein